MCPRCHSPFLLIKKRKGFERVKIALTSKRTYECLDCHKVFRIKDRRRFDRHEAPDWGPTFAAAASADGRFENWRMRLRGETTLSTN